MKNEDIEKISGTSFKGYIYARYDQLCSIFGKPCIPTELDKKTDIEWIIDTPYGVVTIYNYKNGKRYRGKDGLCKSNIYEWHVGANNIESYQWAKTKIEKTIIEQCS